MSEDVKQWSPDDRVTVTDRCMVPPKGWSCSREPGHAGPCAASPDSELFAAIDLARELFASSLKEWRMVDPVNVRQGRFWLGLAASEEKWLLWDCGLGDVDDPGAAGTLLGEYGSAADGMAALVAAYCSYLYSSSYDAPLTASDTSPAADGDSAEFVRLVEAGPERILLDLDSTTATVIVAQLQLAMRHPANRGASAAIARRFTHGLIERLCVNDPSGRLRELFARGNDPRYDVPQRPAIDFPDKTEAVERLLVSVDDRHRYSELPPACHLVDVRGRNDGRLTALVTVSGDCLRPVVEAIANLGMTVQRRNGLDSHSKTNPPLPANAYWDVLHEGPVPHWRPELDA